MGFQNRPIFKDNPDPGLENLLSRKGWTSYLLTCMLPSYHQTIPPPLLSPLPFDLHAPELTANVSTGIPSRCPFGSATRGASLRAVANPARENWLLRCILTNPARENWQLRCNLTNQAGENWQLRYYRTNQAGENWAP